MLSNGLRSHGIIEESEEIRMDKESIVLGSGDLYCTDFQGTNEAIPDDTVIETEDNRLGHIKGGAEIEYWYFENGFDINGVEFGHREAELVKEIENNNGADNIGITAIFRADGIVKNPAIYHSESGKYIKVGYAGNDFELQSGQYVVIFTHTGKKNIYLLDGVSQAEIEEHKDRYGMIDWETVVSMYGTIINQYLDEDGDFIQLQDGTNTITYNAESGINYLSVSVYYRISYLGV